MDVLAGVLGLLVGLVIAVGILYYKYRQACIDGWYWHDEYHIAMDWWNSQLDHYQGILREYEEYAVDQGWVYKPSDMMIELGKAAGDAMPKGKSKAKPIVDDSGYFMYSDEELAVVPNKYYDSWMKDQGITWEELYDIDEVVVPEDTKEEKPKKEKPKKKKSTTSDNKSNGSNGSKGSTKLLETLGDYDDADAVVKALEKANKGGKMIADDGIAYAKKMYDQTNGKMKMVSMDNNIEKNGWWM